MPAEALPMVRTRARRAAADWRADREAAIEIEARLDRGGFDAIGINAEVFVQARELFDTFDQLMIAAQRRRVGLLRDISVRQICQTRPTRHKRADRCDHSFVGQERLQNKDLFAGAFGEYQHADHIFSYRNHSFRKVAHPRHGTWASSRNNNGITARAFPQLFGGLCLAFQETR
jgi:hypothetical protein